MISKRNAVISALYSHLQKPVILNPQTTNRPPYPFVGYTVTTVSMREDNEGGNIISADLAQDISESFVYNDNMMISFTAYSDNLDEAYSLAKLAYGYFKFKGIQTLADNQIAVVDVMDVQTRDIIEVDSYERRAGFDVRLRFESSIERITPEILSYTIQEEV